jgi:hypothetical protein
MQLVLRLEFWTRQKTRRRNIEDINAPDRIVEQKQGILKALSTPFDITILK